MKNTTPFTPEEIKYIEEMRERGKSFVAIAENLDCCQNKVRNFLIKTGRHEPTYYKGKQKPRTIREILEEARTKEEQEKIEREKGWCKIMCCHERKECRDIQHPQNCLVWRLCNDKSKRKLENEYTKGR